MRRPLRICFVAPTVSGCCWFDPLSVPSEIEVLAAERETAIALTAAQHERGLGGLLPGA
jgi:hypothetical protein